MSEPPGQVIHMRGVPIMKLALLAMTPAALWMAVYFVDSLFLGINFGDIGIDMATALFHRLMWVGVGIAAAICFSRGCKPPTT